MSNRRAASDLDARAWEYLDGNVNECGDTSSLRGLGSAVGPPEPQREDVTDRLKFWTPCQRARREAFQARLA